MLLLNASLACSPSPTQSGHSIWWFWPLGGARRAEYVSTDAALPSSLVIEKTGETTSEAGANVATLTWTREDVAGPLGSVSMSSGEGGVYIHAFSDGVAETVFDTPVALSGEDGTLLDGGQVVTETNGYTFTATLVGWEDCPVVWGPPWRACMHMRIDDGDGDDSSGPIFAGEYWLVTHYGPAWFTTTGYSEPWVLADYAWSGDEDKDEDGSPRVVDCDDRDPARSPDAAEVCNGKDDDCDGSVDEDAEGCDTG